MPTLHWLGKDKVINHHQDVPFRLLNHQYGAHADGTQTTEPTGSGNQIIHGDNLEALKALLPQYEGRVKCIYIDPPYNTGNEGWVYNDNVNDPKIKKWLSQVVGKEGEDLSRHDKWLCMMYPRLKLLHKLLAEDGAIFISLDDNEIHSMRLVINEIFGENQFQAEIIIQSNKRGQTYKQIAKTHEYLLCYGKTDKMKLNELPTEVGNYPYDDEIGNFSTRELRNRNPKFGRFNRPNLYFSIYANPNQLDSNGFSPVSLEKSDAFSVEILPLNSQNEESCWRWGKDKVRENVKSPTDTSSIFARRKQDDVSWGVYDKYRKQTVKAKTIWDDNEVISEQGTTELKKIGLGNHFQFPKPVGLIERVLLLATNENSLVLDSFAGSGTTAHAVLKLNQQDGGSRKFITIQMTETNKLGEELNIAEAVTAERVKRVMQGYAGQPGTGGSFDYLTLGEPVFTDGGELNERAGLPGLRQYLYYAETKQALPPAPAGADNVAFLALHDDTAYYFHYEPDAVTTLNHDFLATMRTRAGQYIIYADNCLLTSEFMTQHGIIFKKIPRDISRF